jgi:hypothetical protein
MQRAFLAHHEQAFNELQQFFSPPAPAPEPEIIYVEPEQGTGRLGYADFLPELMKQPLRWR